MKKAFEKYREEHPDKLKKGKKDDNDEDFDDLYNRWLYNVSGKVDSNGNILNWAKVLLDEQYSYDVHTNSLKSAETSLNGGTSNQEDASVSSSAANNGNWQFIGPTQTYQLTNASSHSCQKGLGRLNCMAVDPANDQILYVGSNTGGLWRSTTGGNSWECLTNGLDYIGVSGIYIDPASPQDDRTIYILSGDGDVGAVYSTGVFKSVDNGSSWYLTDLGLNWSVTSKHRGYKLLGDPEDHNTIFAVFENGIFKTINGGLAWNQVDWHWFVDIEFPLNRDDIVLASTNDGRIFRSTDYGETWNEIINNGLPDHPNDRVSIAASKTESSHMYALYTKDASTPSGHFDGLYKSYDYGQTWNLLIDSPDIFVNTAQYNSDIALESLPNSAEVVIGALILWKTSAAGTSIAEVSNTDYPDNTDPYAYYVHADVHNLLAENNNIYALTDGGIFLSTDNCMSWKDISDGLGITQIYHLATDQYNANKICYGAQDNGLNVLENSKAGQWNPADGVSCIIEPGTNTLFASHNGGLVFSKNYGADVYSQRAPQGVHSNFPEVFLDPNDGRSIYYINRYSNSDVYKSTDLGGTWSNLTQGHVDVWAGIHAMGFSKSNPGIIYVSLDYSIYRTPDNGVTWNNITNNLPHHKIYSIVVSPADPNKVWVALGIKPNEGGNGGGVYVSVNGGSSWTSLSTGLPDVPATAMVYQEGSNNRIYLANDLGVYYIDNDHTQWVNFSNGLPSIIKSDLVINYNSDMLQLATFGRGIWETPLIEECTQKNYIGTQYGDQNIYASSITSAANVKFNSSINYYSSGTIELEPGFSVDAGSQFEARTNQTCQTSSNTALSLVNKSTGQGTSNAGDGRYMGPLPGLMKESTDTTGTKTERSLKFYPNPVTAQLTIDLKDFIDTGDKVVQADVYNTLGEIVKSVREHPDASGKLTLTVSDLHYGIYIVRLKCGNEKNEFRFVKK